MSAGLDQVIVGVAFVIWIPAVPLAAGTVPSPAKLANTASGCAPAPRPPTLTPASVATPLPLVTADPTGEPFSENAMLLPPTGAAPTVSVAESVVVPPYTPVAAAGTSAAPAPNGNRKMV